MSCIGKTAYDSATALDDIFTDLLKINYIYTLCHPISIRSKLVSGASIPKKKQIDHIITISRKPKIMV